MTTPTLQETLDAAYSCRLRLLNGTQEMTFEGRTFRRVDLAALDDVITKLERKIAANSRPHGSLSAITVDLTGHCE